MARPFEIAFEELFRRYYVVIYCILFYNTRRRRTYVRCTAIRIIIFVSISSVSSAPANRAHDAGSCEGSQGAVASKGMSAVVSCVHVYVCIIMCFACAKNRKSREGERVYIVRVMLFSSSSSSSVNVATPPPAVYIIYYCLLYNIERVFVRRRRTEDNSNLLRLKLTCTRIDVTRI